MDKRSWEDDLNEFVKTEEGQGKDKYDLKNNNSWMDEIEDYKKWKENKKSGRVLFSGRETKPFV